MPIGTGAPVLANIPADPFVSDPSTFFQLTKKNTGPIGTFADPGTGSAVNVPLPKVGIKSKIRINFIGQAVVVTAAATTADTWPYDVLENVALSANASTDLVSCSGDDLHALRNIRFPAYSEKVDQFPGTVGGGNSVAVGTYPLFLTWELPIAMDETTLIGSLFAQSNQANISLRLQRGLATALFSANPANVTITGSWTVTETWFDVPFDGQGRLIVPDLSKLHYFLSQTTQFANVGEVKVPLVRSAGQLMRLLVSARSSATNRLSAMPNAATSKLIDAVRLEFGANQKPLVYNPAALLLVENNAYYGSPVPYDRVVFDFVRENPQRDIVNLLGVTELNTVITVDAGVTVTAGTAKAVQETLV